MAKYQRGVPVAIKAHAKTVSMYSRRVTEKIKNQNKSVTVLTRGRASSVKMQAKAPTKGQYGMVIVRKVAKYHMIRRTIVEKKEIKSVTWPVGTRGVKEKKDPNDLDPWGNFRFALFIGDKEMAYFQECSGLKTSAEVFEIVEGGLNGRTHKRPAQSKWENITLRYGTSASNELLDWRNQFLQDKFTEGLRTDPKKSTGAIVLMNNAGKVMRRYEFKNAWPVSWEGPSLSSGGSALAVETLEIAHEGLTITEGDG